MPRRGEIGPEGFLQNDPGPAAFSRLVQPGLGQMLNDDFELLGRGCEVKQTIAARSALLVEVVETLGEFLVALFIGEFALVIEEGFGKALPDFVAHRLPRKVSRG